MLNAAGAPPADADAARLLDAAIAGGQRALGRAVSMLENGGPDARALSRRVAAELLRRNDAGERRAHVVGLTGSPGAGKSTATAALVGVARGAGRRVAVLAVDPSSPFSGGAVLGDRVRMQRHALDEQVYIRSLSSRGALGGLSPAVPAALGLLEACRFDLVLVETVGAGQSEVEVARVADTVVVLVAPGFGDSVQVAKAGILEIADVLVVSKADLEGADALRRDLEQMVSLAPAGGAAAVGSDRRARPPVLAVAAATGSGVAELAAELGRQFDEAVASGSLELRRRSAAAAFVESIVRQLLAERLAAGGASGTTIEEVAARVARGELDPYDAAERLLPPG